MPVWLKLSLSLIILGCTLVVPLFVLGQTAGNWRAALRAWRSYALVLLALASPAIVVGIVTTLFRG